MLALGPTQNTGELISWWVCGQDMELPIHLHLRAKVKSEQSYTSTAHILS